MQTIYLRTIASQVENKITIRTNLKALSVTGAIVKPTASVSDVSTVE